MGGLITINKLIFGTVKEANEFVVFAKSKGYDVSKPVREKRAKSARKMYDLNGKPVKFQWKVIMGARGAGKKWVKHEDDEAAHHRSKSSEHSGNERDICLKKGKQRAIKKIHSRMEKMFKEWEKEEAHEAREDKKAKRREEEEEKREEKE